MYIKKIIDVSFQGQFRNRPRYNRFIIDTQLAQKANGLTTAAGLAQVEIYKPIIYALRRFRGQQL